MNRIAVGNNEKNTLFILLKYLEEILFRPDRSVT